MKKLIWVLFALLCILISLYPIQYYIAGPDHGVLRLKSEALLRNVLYKFGFFTHITCGGIALLVGWPQFSQKWRAKYPIWHRNLGKTYLAMATMSGVASLAIALKATGGPWTMLGFATLGTIWIYTTLRAYTSIRNGQVKAHQQYMMLSYAACFGAVTLRLWMPLLLYIFDGAFLPAYRVVAWLSWVPNLSFALYWNRRTRDSVF